MSADERIELGTTHFNLSPLGFYNWGRDFAAAALAVHPHEGFSPVEYFLNCQAIELGLKAFLLFKGMAKSELAKPNHYGHHLERLLDAAQAHGLAGLVTIDSDEQSAITLATPLYGSGKDGKKFQYFDVPFAMGGFKGLPELSVLQQFAHKLVQNSDLERRYIEGA